MAYRFQTPTMQPYPTPPAGYGDGLHKIANTLMMARQMRAQKEEQKKKAEQERLAAEEARRQFDIKQSASDAEAERARRQLALNEEANRRAEDQLVIQKATEAKKLYDAQQRALAGNRADEAMAYAELAAGAKLPGPAGELYRRRAREMMMGMAGGDEPRQMAKGEETDEYRLAVEEVKLAIAPMLENGAQDERDAAAIVGEQVPGLLKQFSGDKEKAGKAALAQVKQLAAARAKERQSIRGAAAARATASGKAEEFDSPGYRRGEASVREATKAADGKTHVNNYVTASDAISMLDQFGSNPKVYGGLLFAAAQALSGQEGRGMSDKDAERIMGESLAEMTEGTFMQKLMGQSGATRRRELRDLLVASAEKSYLQASSAYERSMRAAEIAQRSAGGRVGGRDFAAGSESALAADYLPIMEEYERRNRKAKPKSAKVPVAKTIDDVEAFLE